MTASLVVLAHQGGWDEMLLVATPIVIFVVLLKLANDRAQRLAEKPSGEPDDGADRGGPSDR